MPSSVLIVPGTDLPQILYGPFKSSQYFLNGMLGFSHKK